MLSFHTQCLFLNVPVYIQFTALQIAIYPFTKSKVIYGECITNTDFIYFLSLLYLLGGKELILKQHKINQNKKLIKTWPRES